MKKIKVDRKMTSAELKEWFGSEMPIEVATFLLSEAPKDMAIGEVRDKIRQMAVDFRSPPSLALQSFELLAEIKKNGNLTHSLTAQIAAWESRFFIWRREEDAKAAEEAERVRQEEAERIERDNALPTDSEPSPVQEPDNRPFTPEEAAAYEKGLL